MLGALVDDFVAATWTCLHAAVGVDAAVNGAAAESQAPTLDITLDLRGGLSGPVTWRFPQGVALELVRRLMGDPEPSVDTAIDGAMELANILTGRASEAFERAGLHCELGPPRRHEGALPSGVTVHMHSSGGEIALILSLTSAS